MSRAPSTPRAVDAARLAHAADRATADRARSGAAMYAIAIVVLDATFELWRRAHALAIGLTIAMAVLCAVRQVFLSVDRWVPRIGAPAWRAIFAVATLGMSLVLGVYVGASVLLSGTHGSTALMVAVLQGYVFGAVYALAPRRMIGRVMVVLLTLPSIAAVLSIGGSTATFATIFLVMSLAYAMQLARGLHREYWDALFGREELVAQSEALARSQAQTSELIEKNPDAMIVVCDGKIASVNAAWTRAMQRPAEAFVGEPFDAFADVADAAAARALVEGADDAARSADVRFVRKDGAVVVWELGRAPSIEHEGRMASLVVGRDVTERDRMRQQLAVSDRLASIGTLSAGVAHEINNPLTYVLLNLEHVVEELEADAPLQADAAKELAGVARDAHEGAKRVRSIVRDLKAFASDRGESELGAVDVGDAVRLALKMADSEIRHRARVELAIRDEVPPVLADEAKLGQAFLNLLVNAAQAIPEGAAVENVIRVEVSKGASGDVVVEVSDTGVGIAPERLARIFDPFFTTKGVGVGMGLGLSICHRTIRSFGGDISVTSHVGRGTTFTVLLEPAPAGEARLASGPAATTHAAATGGRVLVIDDEPAIAAAIRRALGPNVDVVVEERARRALGRLVGGERFDVILCDLMMPEMTGMDLYAELERAKPAIAPRVVFMTGGTFTQRGSTFLREVPNARLEKPFDPAKLRSLVCERMRSARDDAAA